MTQTDHIPAKVLAAFDGRAALPLPELAKAVEINIQTLRRHRDQGTLPVHVKGFGVARQHCVCTLADVAEFYRNIAASRSQPCRSASKIPLTGNTISKSAVIAFPARQNAGMSVTLRKQKRRPAPRPDGLSSNP